MSTFIRSIAWVMPLLLSIALPAGAQSPEAQVSDTPFSDVKLSDTQLSDTQFSDAESSNASSSIDQLQADLETAKCLNDWAGALEVIRQLIGSEQITADQREQLVAERRQLEDDRANQTVVDRSSDEACAEAIAANSQPIEIAVEPLPFDWDWEVEALGLNRFIGQSLPFDWQQDIALLGLNGFTSDPMPFDWDQESTVLGLDRFRGVARQQR